MRHVLFVLALVLLSPPPCAVASGLADVSIEAPFREPLLDDPGFMKKGGARVFRIGDEIFAVGVGKAFVENGTALARRMAVLEAQLDARAALVAARDGVLLSTARGGTEDEPQRVALSAFFQVSAREVEGSIARLPVVGTWMRPSRGILYVAVASPPVAEPTMDGRVCAMEVLDSRPPFEALVRSNPMLCQNGGVRIFAIDGAGLAVAAVGLAAIKGGELMAARRAAQLEARRAYMGFNGAVDVRSVQVLEHGEVLVREDLDQARPGNYAYDSGLTSRKLETMFGKAKALPVVLFWRVPGRDMVGVALGSFISD